MQLSPITPRVRISVVGRLLMIEIISIISLASENKTSSFSFYNMLSIISNIIGTLVCSTHRCKVSTVSWMVKWTPEKVIWKELSYLSRTILSQAVITISLSGLNCHFRWRLSQGDSLVLSFMGLLHWLWLQFVQFCLWVCIKSSFTGWVNVQNYSQLIKGSSETAHWLWS